MDCQTGNVSFSMREVSPLVFAFAGRFRAVAQKEIFPVGELIDGIFEVVFAADEFADEALNALATGGFCVVRRDFAREIEQVVNATRRG